MNPSLRWVVMQIESSRIALDAALWQASTAPGNGTDHAAEVRMAWGVLRGWVGKLRGMADELEAGLPPEGEGDGDE